MLYACGCVCDGPVWASFVILAGCMTEKGRKSGWLCKHATRMIEGKGRLRDAAS